MSTDPQATHPDGAPALPEQTGGAAPPQPTVPLPAGGDATSGVDEAPPPAGAGATASPQAAAEAPRKLRSRWKSEEGALGVVQSLTITVVIAIFVITFLVQAFQIPSQSMENTLLIGDYLLVDKVPFSPGGAWQRLLPYQPVERGDIIVFRFPANPQQHFVKRVVGIPGDRVRLINKHLYVNGERASEAYALFKSPIHDQFRDNFPSRRGSGQVEAKWWEELPERIQRGELVVPRGAYFVLGDNRDESLDSRYWGFVPRENIIGRPMLIYLSLKSPEETGGDGANVKLTRLAYVLTHLTELARWDRTLRVVK